MMHHPAPPKSLVALVAVAVLVTTAGSPGQDPAKLADRLTAAVHSTSDSELPYRLFTPQVDRPPAGYPLVLFLHGAGERGDDNRSQLVHGVADFVAEAAQAERPCFVLAPQCPRGVWWMDPKVYPTVIDLLQDTMRRHPVDPARVYVTGLSMGGYGSWHALANHPRLFAAAVPICGGGDPKTVTRFVRVPTWTFHGGADNVVAPEKSRAMVDALTAAGGCPKYTEYEGVRHNSWAQTYANPAVHRWLFAQSRTPAALVLRDGDRIAFLGDSITQAGARPNGYIRMIETDLRTRLPDLDLTCIGAGISGHKVPDLQKRLDRDVIAKRPTIVFIYIGINDVWHWNRNRGTKKEPFESGLFDLIRRIRAARARVILCTPSVIGEKTDGTNRFDAMLAEYSAISRGVAAAAGTELLDLRVLFMDHLRAHNPENADRGVLTSDSVHLNEAGNRFVANRMLEALGVTPTVR